MKGWINMNTTSDLLTVNNRYKLNSGAMSFILRQGLNISLEPYDSLALRLSEWVILKGEIDTDQEKIYWYRLFEIWRRIVSRAMKDDNLRLVGYFKAAFYKWYGVRL
jgi:hypothetical protein